MNAVTHAKLNALTPLSATRTPPLCVPAGTHRRDNGGLPGLADATADVPPCSPRRRAPAGLCARAAAAPRRGAGATQSQFPAEPRPAPPETVGAPARPARPGPTRTVRRAAPATCWPHKRLYACSADPRLLLSADGHCSNGSRSRLSTFELHELARPRGLRDPVCHFPALLSKSNKISQPNILPHCRPPDGAGRRGVTRW